MKIMRIGVTLIILGLAVLSMLMVIGALTDQGKFRQDKLSGLTPYQRCEEQASHLRSEADTKSAIDTMCSRIPYEKGDYK